MDSLSCLGEPNGSSPPTPFMLEYKKRFRMIADRHGLDTEYLPDRGLSVRSGDSTGEFIPTCS